jgi:hypothetical protein
LFKKNIKNLFLRMDIYRYIYFFIDSIFHNYINIFFRKKIYIYNISIEKNDFLYRKMIYIYIARIFKNNLDMISIEIDLYIARILKTKMHIIMKLKHAKTKSELYI